MNSFNLYRVKEMLLDENNRGDIILLYFAEISQFPHILPILYFSFFTDQKLR